MRARKWQRKTKIGERMKSRAVESKTRENGREKVYGA